VDETIDQRLAELLGSRVPESARPSPRERIVQAALQLFAEHSYGGATTKAIAQRAGITERTLFKYFPSKEELFGRTVFPALLQVLAPVTAEPAIERARASGQIRDLPTDVVLGAIVGQIAGFVVTRLLLAPDLPWDDEREAERIVGLIMHGIAGTHRVAGTAPTGAEPRWGW